MRSPPLNALRTFEAVLRTGSFQAAADELFVTQSAVSHQIRHLEQWFGAPLFNRTGPRPRPLDHAAELGRALSVSFAEIGAACERARLQRRGRALVIAAIPSVAVCWLIPRLAAFRAHCPEVEVRIVYALHGRDVDFGDVDFAFVFGGSLAVRAGVRAEAFLPGRAVPVCSPALAERAGVKGDAAGVIARLGLLHDTDEGGWRHWFARAGAPAPPAGGGPIFEDFNLLRAAALAGQGVALCPLAMVEPDLAAGRLMQLSDVSVGEEYGYFLLSGPLAGDPLGREARAFRDWAFAERAGEGLAAPARGAS
jgi:LysR family glycine cleavage system transcriptional activator